MLAPKLWLISTLLVTATDAVITRTVTRTVTSTSTILPRTSTRTVTVTTRLPARTLTQTVTSRPPAQTVTNSVTVSTTLSASCSPSASSSASSSSSSTTSVATPSPTSTIPACNAVTNPVLIASGTGITGWDGQALDVRHFSYASGSWIVNPLWPVGQSGDEGASFTFNTTTGVLGATGGSDSGPLCLQFPGESFDAYINVATGFDSCADASMAGFTCSFTPPLGTLQCTSVPIGDPPETMSVFEMLSLPNNDGPVPGMCIGVTGNAYGPLTLTLQGGCS